MGGPRDACVCKNVCTKLFNFSIVDPGGRWGDAMIGVGDTDKMHGGYGDNKMSGGNESDKMRRCAHADRLIGGANVDTIYADQGFDDGFGVETRVPISSTAARATTPPASISKASQRYS